MKLKIIILIFLNFFFFQISIASNIAYIDLNYIINNSNSGKIISDKSKIVIKNLDIKKRPISAVADNFEVRNAKIIKVKSNEKIKFSLLYDKNRSLQKKIKLEQIKKEIS